jgi:hypothetical protein
LEPAVVTVFRIDKWSPKQISNCYLPKLKFTRPKEKTEIMKIWTSRNIATCVVFIIFRMVKNRYNWESPFQDTKVAENTSRPITFLHLKREVGSWNINLVKFLRHICCWILWKSFQMNKIYKNDHVYNLCVCLRPLTHDSSGLCLTSRTAILSMLYVYYSLTPVLDDL